MPKNTNIKLKIFGSKSRLKGVRHYENSFQMSMQFSSGLVGCDVKGFTFICNQSVAVLAAFVSLLSVLWCFCEMACVSRDEISDHSFESTEEQSSETSEDSFHSTIDDFLPYAENLKPMANEQEAAAYVEQVAREEEEEQILWSRFSGEEGVES